MKLPYTKTILLFAILLANFAYSSLHAQTCPPNIDFENGTFDGWTCYTGYVTGNGVNQINLNPSSGPVSGQHTMYTSFPGDGNDPYGGFPINCPNGSGHSIKLGNNTGGGQAEGISYEFVIPANEDYYTLIYNYAVVFQDPNHEVYQQPRMEIEITNVTDNSVIYCSSFTFIPYGSILPGFFQSPDPGTETPVWCKDWTAVSINLDGHAGKRIKLFFKTADCTFQRHFGYAYIDVNSECSGTFVGATYCPEDTLINVVAPYGYQNYTWFNNTFSQALGNQQVLTLQPPPPAGTTIAVELIPYSGYGCPDTLYARLLDSLTVTADAGIDKLSCNHDPVPIGTPPKPGIRYKWFPATGLNNPNIANPHASPDVTTTYVLTTIHDGGGCFDTDTVVVSASILDTTMGLAGNPVYCIGRGASPVLSVQLADSIQWFRDDIAIAGAITPNFNVISSGDYKALLIDKNGCRLFTHEQAIAISSIPVAEISAGITNQCLVGNQFVFANGSTNAVGALQYRWDLGNGFISSSKDISYSYPKAGVYNVKMIVSSNTVCTDSASFTVTIYQNAVADFKVDGVCTNLPMIAVNNTLDTIGSQLHYLWNFGNGQTSTLRNPPVQVYANGGTYSINLSVYTDQCPTPLNTMVRNVVIEKPKPGIRYPVRYAVVNYPLELEARGFGSSVLWTPAAGLDDRTSVSPVFKGIADQLYTIEIKTSSGCITLDTQMVKAVSKAEIYVPTAFTPNNDGLNDILRPIVFGVKDIRYFKIFNRWGQLVFEQNNILQGWDGKLGGVAQTSQIFVWMVEGVGVDGRIITKKGTVMLIR